MRQLTGIALALLFCVGLAAAYWLGPQPQHQQFRVLFVAANGSVEKITRGLDELHQRAPEFASRFNVRVLAPSNTFDEADLPPHNVLIVESMDGSWVSSLSGQLSESGATQRLALGASGIHDDPQLLERLGFIRDDTIEAYWENSAPGEIATLFQYFAARYLGIQDLTVEPPRPKLAQGFIQFSQSGIELIAHWDGWYSLHADDQRPRVGILEYASRARAEGLALSRAVAAELDRRGYLAVPLFAERATPALDSLLFNADGSARVSALISFHHKFFEESGAATLQALDIPVINVISVAGRTVEEWQQSVQGLTSSEIARQLAIPELSGLAPAMVVGAVDNTLSDITLVPVADRVQRVAGRAIRYAELRNKSLADHKVAILYWNYPPGKQNVGASYLNVVRSIPALLRRMQDHGYSVSDLPPLAHAGDEDPLSDLIIERGRNIGHYAPGELQVLVDGGDVVTVSMAQYQDWFDDLPPRFRNDVIAMWGQPDEADIMVTRIAGQQQIILPVLQFGNVVVMPQPDRARMQNLDALYQSQELPPHHQYVAAYLWLQHEFAADAIVHTGTHGTHEWLSGKESGLAGDDPGEVLAGEMAIIYPYIVDDVGEGIVAKRRGMSTIVDHLTPALGQGEISPELGRLRAQLESWRMALNTDPEAAATVAGQIEQEVQDRGLALDLQDRGWSVDAPADRATKFAVLEDYLSQIEAQTIPLGLHTLGIELSADRLQRFTDSIAQANGQHLWQTANERLKASVESEIDGIFTGLAGRYVRPGPGNDPVRNIDAIPTGKNFMSFDPRAIPMESADILGREMAESLIATHTQTHGEAPRKIALQLWGVESLRHQGVQEAQGLALLGVRPVRAGNGRISGLELIPREELGRPRVDVVFHATSLYRDTFPMLFELIDQAVQLAASSPEQDNPLRQHAQALEAELLDMGVSAAQARTQSLLRIFAEPSGKHDSKVHAMTHASGSWDTEQQVAETYIRRMGHGYGSGAWGTSAEHAFRAALKDTDVIVHSRASSLYATLDNDDYFSYGGSIALGVRQANGGGASPDFYVTDLRKAGQERHEPLERFMGQELRSRYLNPEFAREMMAEGYAGARDIWKATDYLWGWAVVYPEAVDAAKWQEMYDVWLNDRYDLDMDAYFEQHSPYARQGIAARMLETVRKGYWDAPEATLQHLTQIYVDSLVDHGPSCDHLTCDNPELQVFVQDIVRSGAGVDMADLDAAMASIEQATQRSIDDALTQRVEDRVRWHEPPAVADPSQQPELAEAPGETSEQVVGYQLEEEITQTTPGSESSLLSMSEFLLQISLLLILLASMAAGMRAGLQFDKRFNSSLNQ